MRYYTDPRQSPAWGESLGKIGWNVVRTSNDIQIALFKTPFGSLVKIQRPDNLSQTDLAEIEKICTERKSLFIKIEPAWNQDIKIMRECGYENSYFPLIPTKTMFIDLTLTEDELKSKLSDSARYSLNRARREKAHTEFYVNPNDEKLTEFYRILKFTGKRKKFYVEPYQHLVNKRNSFSDLSFLTLVYDSAGVVNGGKFFAGYKKNCFYVSGGTGAEGLKNKSGYLLTWDSFFHLKNAGMECLDLEGMYDRRFPSFTSNWGGFTHFKEKFGGDVVEFPHPQIKYINPVFKYFSKFSPIGM